MNSIIQLCLRDLRGYTPASVFLLLEEKMQTPHFLFEVKGAYLFIGVNQKNMRYKTLESFNGSFENIEILKTIASFYGVKLEQDIEPYISEFINQLQTIDFTKPPIYLV